MAGMSSPEALGHENIDDLPHELVAAVAKEPFRLSVEKNNAPVLSHENHGIGRRFKERAEFVFRAFAIGDVPYRARDEDSPEIPLRSTPRFGDPKSLRVSPRRARTIFAERPALRCSGALFPDVVIFWFVRHVLLVRKAQTFTRRS
jgi:hypothetical protein